jgi:chromosome segregation ATPase
MLAMANSPDTDDSIEGLLEQRTRFEQWLAKLDGTGDKAPAAVRQKVRADYESRLRGVIDRLRGHSATIAEELERHQTARSDLDGRHRDAEEELAEAEVRYAVGEFEEDEWSRIREESERRLSGLRQELQNVGSEITRLAEVQSLISATPRKAEPAPAPQAPPPPKEEVIERSPPPPPPPPPAEAVTTSSPQRLVTGALSGSPLYAARQ